VAGRPFVDRRQVDLAVVLLGQVRVDLLGVQSSGGGVMK
jgi:hypothetical protein